MLYVINAHVAYNFKMRTDSIKREEHYPFFLNMQAGIYNDINLDRDGTVCLRSFDQVYGNSQS